MKKVKYSPFLFLSLILFSLSCSVGYDVNFEDGSDSIGEQLFDFNWGDQFPTIPTGVFATNDATDQQYTNKIIILWNSASNVAYSRLFWFSTADEAYTAFKDARRNYFKPDTFSGETVTPKLSRNEANQTEYHHQFLSTGTIYHYIIKNYDSNQNIIGASDPFYGETVKLPYNINAEQKVANDSELLFGSTSLKITWDWNKNWKTDGFNLYKGYSADVEQITEKVNLTPIILRNLDKQYYENDTIKKEYFGNYIYYVLKPIINGKESKYPSEIFMGMVALPGSPNPPIITSIQKKDHIFISWDSDPNATRYSFFYKFESGNLNPPISIPQSTSGTVTYEFYPPSGQKPSVPATEKPTDNYFQNFEFYVMGIGEIDGKESPGLPSNKITTSILQTPSLTTWTWLDSTIGNNLGWTSDIEGATFNVYRSEADSFSTSTKLTATPVTEKLFSDTEATSYVRYFYWITANIDGLETFESDSVDSIRGDITPPVFTITQGDKEYIEIKGDSPLNTSLKTVVEYRYTQYDPTFRRKPSAGGGSTPPSSYEDSLNYICTPRISMTSYDDKVNDQRIADVETLPATNIPVTENFILTFGQKQTEKFITETGDKTFILTVPATNFIEKPLPPGPVEVKIYYVFEGGGVSIIGDERIRSGYRAITAYEFANEALTHIAMSQSRMTNIHNSFSISSSTSPSKEENIITNGKETIHFSPKVVGLGAVVNIHYYSHLDANYYLTINNPNATFDYTTGGYLNQTTEADINSNGNLFGGDHYSGIYSRYLYFNLTITGANKTGGDYHYFPSADVSTKVVIPWDFDRHITTKAIGK